MVPLMRCLFLLTILGEFMALTINELEEKLKRFDEITLIELLGVDSSDIVNAFRDLIEDKFDKLEGEVNDY